MDRLLGAYKGLLGELLANIMWKRGKSMAKEFDEKQIATFEELLMVNVIQLDTVTQLLVEKGVFTEEEFFSKLKKVQYAWESKKGAKV